ncbi:MAG: hypothetical protein LQ340_000168 [Diploschistes diacapsis]|nr:MAG: hypothetical protein LQ340_000168 [Diploschistes diacapsis]
MATQFINQGSLDAAFKNYSNTFTRESLDFDNTVSPEATTLLTPTSPTSQTEGKDEKQTKKRRKRAKTEAEKEQRRIERVIRNRLAAHSSRERKRKEVECLEDQKGVVEEENQRLKQQLAILASKNRELQEENISLRAKLGLSPKEPETTEQQFKQEAEHFHSIPSPPLSDGSYSVDHRDSSPSPTPSSPATDIQDFAVSSDMTQHPAAML